MDTFWPLGDVEQGNSMGRMPVCSIRDYLQFMTEPTMNQIIKMRYQGPLGGGGGEIFTKFFNHGEQGNIRRRRRIGGDFRKFLQPW